MTVTPVTQTNFVCGHHEVVGGNIADPEGLHAEMAGLKTFVKSANICTYCESPSRFPRPQC